MEQQIMTKSNKVYYLRNVKNLLSIYIGNSMTSFQKNFDLLYTNKKTLVFLDLKIIIFFCSIKT